MSPIRAHGKKPPAQESDAVEPIRRTPCTMERIEEHRLGMPNSSTP